MSNLSVFLNTRVEDSGVLAWIGDKGLAPARYLFHGKTVRILISDSIDRVSSFHKDGELHFSRTNPRLRSSSKNIVKTALAIVLLIPGLILAVFKGLSYLSAETRGKHFLVKENLTPVNRTIGSIERPISDVRTLKRELKNRSRPTFHFFPTNALIIYGDGKLTINDDPGILFPFNPKKLILVGAKIVHGSSNSPSGPIDEQMAESGKWQTSGSRIVTPNDNATSFVYQKTVNSLFEALQTPAPRRGWFTNKRYHMIFNVVGRPQSEIS